MSKFARFSPARYREKHRGEELPKRMISLSRGTYLGVQHTLENVWFGQSAPIEQACQHVQTEFDIDTSETEIRLALAEFINLLIRTLGFNESINSQEISNLKFLYCYEAGQLREVLTRGNEEIMQLRKEVKEMDALRREVLEKHREVTKLRERKKKLTEAEENLRTVVKMASSEEIDWSTPQP